VTPLLLAAAGGLGAACRLLADGLIRSRTRGHFPWGTTLVNLTGSFALGCLVGLAPQDDVRLVLGTGFLGGYTTFSTASFEVAERVLDHRRPIGIATALTMLVGCVASATLGVQLGRSL
jgi:CrcB protein